MQNETINILTWNVQKKYTAQLETALYEVTKTIDVIVLQEAGPILTKVLESSFDEIIDNKENEKNTLRIFIKKNTFDYNIEKIYKGEQSKLLFVPLIKKTNHFSVNIAGVHLHSKVGNGEDRERVRTRKNKIIIDKVKELEKNLENYKTILVGDFNQNPYDGDLVDFETIPSMQYTELINVLSDPNSIFPDSIRKVDFWYNPMWNFIGDKNQVNNENRKTGSYFLYSDSTTKMWHLIDGFILRPATMKHIDINYAESGIVDATNSVHFLKPNKIKNKYSLIDEQLSDHLPVKISLSLK